VIARDEELDEIELGRRDEIAAERGRGLRIRTNTQA
jgi:hypothetical protein